MRTFAQFLDDIGFQSDACESCIEHDFYRLAERMHKALETIADPSTTEMTHYGTVLVLRSHAKNALR